MMKTFVFACILSLLTLTHSHAENDYYDYPNFDPLKEWKLSSFYEEYVWAGNIPIVSSGEVPIGALYKARETILGMMKHSPALLKYMHSIRLRVPIIGLNENTTDIPEYSHLKDKEYWNKRARGLGPTLSHPAASNAEENVLCYGPELDRWHGQNILVHEFAHAVFLALRESKKKLHRKIVKSYRKAMESGIWNNTYAATNANEYFAEMTQSWFDANHQGPIGGNGVKNHISTREALRDYDPTIVEILEEVYGDLEWRPSCPDSQED